MTVFILVAGEFPINSKKIHHGKFVSFMACIFNNTNNWDTSNLSTLTLL